MKKVSRKALTITILLALMPLTAFADTGFYMGGSIGSASLNDDLDGFDIDSDSTAFRLNVGWQVTEYFSLEAGYHNFGEFEQTFDIDGQPLIVSLDADGITLGGTGNLPVSERFALYGRAGAFFWQGNAEINSVSQASPDDTNLYLGVGTSFAFNSKLKLLADWTRYKLEDTESDVISLGLTYRF